MEDHEIVALYFARSERAITETARKFGAYCRKIAWNILASRRDAEECENDTWLAAWNTMPPQRPARLAPYLGRITRNLALDRYDQAHAAKRGGFPACCRSWTIACRTPPPSTRRWRPPRPPGGSVSFCGLSRRRPGEFFCGDTGTATRPATLPGATVSPRARSGYRCTGPGKNSEHFWNRRGWQYDCTGFV